MTLANGKRRGRSDHAESTDSFGQTLGVVGGIAVQMIRRRMMVLVCYNCCG